MFNLNFNTKSDYDFNKEQVEKVPGLNYYTNFITIDEEEYLLEYLSNLEYTSESGRATKYYGYNYSHKKQKSDENDFIDDIPNELNVIFNNIGIKYNQLVIEKIPVNKYYTFPVHSKIFSNNIITLSIGGNCVSEFENMLTDEKCDVLIKKRALLVISDECRKEWSYKINSNKTHRFNDKKVKRDDRYTLTFKNIKFIGNKADDDDVYYFAY